VDGFQLACRVADSNQLLDLKHLNCVSWLGKYTTTRQSLSHCYTWFVRRGGLLLSRHMRLDSRSSEPLNGTSVFPSFSEFIPYDNEPFCTSQILEGAFYDFVTVQNSFQETSISTTGVDIQLTYTINDV
jgi:hypothetical protein